MKMFIGGASQGKLAYAKQMCPQVSWIDGNTCEIEEIYHCQGIYHFHAYIERSLQSGKSVNELAERVCEKNPDICIVTDEIGYGIVPMDRNLREYREQTGRICTKLASFSTEVHRIICGIGTRIK